MSEVIDLETIPVEFVVWPANADRRSALARAGVPRVLLVAADAEPPTGLGLDEDWIRVPAPDGDLLARAQHVLTIGARRRAEVPVLDEARVLHRAGLTVVLTEAEAAAMSLLLERLGSVVDHAELEQRIWRGAAPSRDAMDAAIYRLRRRLSRLGMQITSIRGRGFVLNV